MYNKGPIITLKDTKIENLKEYIYTRHAITLGRGNQMIEINRKKRNTGQHLENFKTILKIKTYQCICEPEWTVTPSKQSLSLK